MVILNFRNVITVLLGRSHAWIGLNDIENEGKFVFIDGVTATAENAGWNANEPNGGRNENCVLINWEKHPNTTANDISCNFKTSALCEKALLF